MKKWILIIKNYFSGLAIQGGFFLALVIALASSSH
jgi:prolipoprotein diacylglyceryltransferase